MREEYVQKVKAYIQNQPDTEEGLANIKDYVREFGATEEEFAEALRQVVFESIGKKYTPSEQPHELMVLPEKELAERPEHELLIPENLDLFVRHDRQLRRRVRPTVHTDAVSEIKDEIAKSQKEQLTTFQRELYETKASLLQAFDDELEKQRAALMANQQVMTEQDPLQKHMPSRLGHPVFQAGLAIAVILMSVTTLLLTFMTRNSQKIDSHAKESTPQFTLRPGVQQVYANALPLDPDQVFSFPPSNVTLVASSLPKKEVLGFLPYWMLPDERKISFTNLTTISFFGLEMDGGGNIVTTDSVGKPDGGWQMYNDPQLSDAITRARKGGIKLLYTLKMFDNTHIEDMVRSDEAQKRFISNALYIVNSKGLNGINLDFEYVGDPPQDVRDGFTRLVQNLHTSLQQQAPGTKLTIDTYATAGADPKLFDVRMLSLYADAIIVMGYDMHTPVGDPGPIAPMESEIGIVGLMQSYLNKVTPDKLILAVPYYGYDWPIPKASDSATIVSYAQAADQSKALSLQWDDTSQSPSYAYTDPMTGIHHEVHFENTRSLGAKYDFVNQKNLQGIGIWALGYDGLNTDLGALIGQKFGESPVPTAVQSTGITPH